MAKNIVICCDGTGNRAEDFEDGRPALSNVATTLSDMGRVDEAAERMRALLAEGADLPIDHYNLGIIEARRLRFDEAEAELRRALALRPTYADAQRALPFVKEARLAWEGLPPESPGEPTSVRALRASFWERMGVPGRAAPLWTEVARAPDAPADALLAASAFLVRQGDPRAPEVLARARAAGAPPAQLGALETAWTRAHSPR